MTPESVQAPEPSPAGMGAFARIIGVFFEPKKTFEDIAARPTWFPPLLLICLATLAFIIIFTQHIGWEGVVRQQMENNPQVAQMPAAQRDAAIANGARFAAIFGYLTVIFVPIAYLAIAGILMGITAIMSGGLRFKQVFSVVCYSGLPSIVFSILATAVMFLKSPAEFNIQNPLVFNVGAFMDPSSKKLWTLGTSLDLFSFWMILLIATGLKAAAGKRLSFGQALFAVVLPWAIYVGIKAAIA